MTFKIFFLFFPEQETICLKCQILFSVKNKKDITNLSSAETDQRVIKVDMFCQNQYFETLRKRA